MRYVVIKDVKPDTVLAHQIVDTNGRVLASENSKLTESAIERVKKSRL